MGGGGARRAFEPCCPVQMNRRHMQGFWLHPPLHPLCVACAGALGTRPSAAPYLPNSHPTLADAPSS